MAVAGRPWQEVLRNKEVEVLGEKHQIGVPKARTDGTVPRINTYERFGRWGTKQSVRVMVLALRLRS